MGVEEKLHFSSREREIEIEQRGGGGGGAGNSRGETTTREYHVGRDHTRIVISDPVRDPDIQTRGGLKRSLPSPVIDREPVA